MARRTMLVFALTAGALGCGTIHNVKHPTRPPAGNPNASVCVIYGGLRGDWEAITEYNWKEPPSYADYVVVPLLCALDLLLTAGGDTVTLPYTVGGEVARFVRPSPSPDPPALKAEAERARATKATAEARADPVPLPTTRDPLQTGAPARSPGAAGPR